MLAGSRSPRWLRSLVLAMFGLALFAASAEAFPPLAETEAATEVAYEEATLNGFVNPVGLKTTYVFEYGLTTSYGSKTAETSAGSGVSNVKVKAPVTGLADGTTYHFRIVATNSSGTTKGKDLTFATLETPSPWALQSTPNPEGGNVKNHHLERLSCVSESACVAVGDGEGQTLAEQWNGSEWTLMTTPSPGTSINELSGVSCTASNSCTAVGLYSGSGGPHPLAMRWNGSEWKTQEVPEPAGSVQAQFDGVSCTSSTACTAVGHYQEGEGNNLTLAERWNGSEWKVQATPNATITKGWGSYLADVSCTSATACMAVGRGNGNSFSVSWNGSEWSLLTMPKAPPGMPGISCTASNACTAVGSTASPEEPVAFRWNGSEWSSQSVPDPAESERALLLGVSCASSTSCYGVGFIENGAADEPFAERWNGSKWEIEKVAKPIGSAGASLHGVFCTSTTVCEAVGAFSNSPFDITTLAARRSE